MARDYRITAQLEAEGWHVIRVWESEIKRNPRRVAALISAVLARRKRR